MKIPFDIEAYDEVARTNRRLMGLPMEQNGYPEIKLRARVEFRDAGRKSLADWFERRLGSAMLEALGNNPLFGDSVGLYHGVTVHEDKN